MIKKLVQNIVLIFLGIILLLVIYSKYIKKECVVKLGGYGFLIVLTESMEPTIFPQEFILIKELNNYELNDVVTYQSLDGTLITHRILQIDQDGFIAKGDKNQVTDARIALETIQGKVVFHSLSLGIFVIRYLKIIAIFCLTILGMLILRKLIKEKRSEKEE